MKNSNEHQVREILQPAELVKDLEDQIVNQLLDLFRSHHAHLKERVIELSKKPKCNDTHRAYTDANGFRICGNCSRVGGFNEALDEVIKLLE